jgi:hypothetical protein
MNLKCLTSLFFALMLGLSACAWNPEVAAVPMTEPWASMGLPVQENAVVWASTDSLFKAAHKEDRKAVTTRYVEALTSKGWKMDAIDEAHEMNTFVEMSKGADKLSLDIYVFRNTGVIIEKK